jgi:TM2 domain-containing membrane protein YozV
MSVLRIYLLGVIAGIGLTLLVFGIIGWAS